VGKHKKTEDLNSKPYDESATPETKAREFDQQYGQNRRPAPTSPNLDDKRKRDGK
jgi:hypothetical protein